jgi:hypothetical protein
MITQALGIMHTGSFIAGILLWYVTTYKPFLEPLFKPRGT